MFKDNLFLETSEKLANLSEITNKNKINEDIFISEIDIDNKLSKQINKIRGKYITISFNKNRLNKNIEKLIGVLNDSISNTLKYLGINKKSKILFVGLGNKSITCDSLGYHTIEKIGIEGSLYKIYKDVEGITNINSYEFIKSISNTLEIDLVVIFDSLKSENITRLGSTIQISTGGLYPGSAVTDKSNEISKRTIRKNVICIGVPTIINLENVNPNNPDMLVSTKDIDLVIDGLSSIISMSINRIF